MKMALLRLSLRGASWLLHKGDKLSLSVANPFGFLMVPKSRRCALGTSIGRLGVRVWHQCWQRGAHTPRRTPNGPLTRRPGAFLQWTHHKEPVTFGHKTALLPSGGMWVRTGPGDGGGWRCMLWVKMTNSYEWQRTTTETFFFSQVKCP